MQNLILNWATSFVNLFQKYSQSELRLPKLHNWCYHIIATIKEYGAINGFTTETYEALHKDSVKKPYRASNKREATDQMIKTVSIFNINESNNYNFGENYHLFNVG